MAGAACVVVEGEGNGYYVFWSSVANMICFFFGQTERGTAMGFFLVGTVFGPAFGTLEFLSSFQDSLCLSEKKKRKKRKESGRRGSS